MRTQAAHTRLPLILSDKLGRLTEAPSVCACATEDYVRLLFGWRRQQAALHAAAPVSSNRPPCCAGGNTVRTVGVDDAEGGGALCWDSCIVHATITVMTCE